MKWPWVMVVLSACGPGVAGEMDAGSMVVSEDAGVVVVENDAGVEPGDAGVVVVDEDAGVPEVPDAGPSMTWAIVAQGHFGRVTRSCDLGRSWVDDQSESMGLDRCWVAVDGGQTVECDHQDNAGRGITFGDGWFMANFGWGTDGSIRRSRDGVHWEIVDDGKAFGNTVFVDGRFVAASSYPKLSDDGLQWRAAGAVADVWNVLGNVRRAGAGTMHDAGVVVMAGDKGFAISLDGGAGWFVPVVPAECRSDQNAGGVEVAFDRVVVAGRPDSVCVTTDLHQWTVVDMPGTVDSQLTTTSTGFELWGRGPADAGNKPTHFTSTDGLTWRSEPSVLEVALADGGVRVDPGPSIGALTHAGSTRVAVKGGWTQWYEQQRFYWSDDGARWHTVLQGAYTGSHPVRFMSAGRIDAALCP